MEEDLEADIERFPVKYGNIMRDDDNLGPEEGRSRPWCTAVSKVMQI